MTRPSIAFRVVRGMTLVAILSALALAGTAALISRFVWRADEERSLDRMTSALTEAIQAEATEEGTPFEEAGPEALKDAAIAGNQVEIWSRGRLIYQRPEGEAMGPPPPEAGPFRHGGRLLHAKELSAGIFLLVGTTEEGERAAIRVFAWSLVLSLPLCLILAVGVGRTVGRRATRPLLEFTARVTAMKELGGPGATGVEAMTDLWRSRRSRDRETAPAEIADLDEAFHRLLERLTGTLRRETEFAANASHELRTPLTNIRLYAEEASRGASQEGQRALADQMREIDRMVQLIDSLLIMARESGSGGLPLDEAVNLADLARDGAASPDLPDEALVRGDERLLRIAVENLLDNARKFTPPGGTAHVMMELADDLVRLRVVSPGARIDAQTRERLFERFYRSPGARASHEGHGLGLSLSRHIANLHAGDVRCDSSPEEDACFTLELPAWRPVPGRRVPPGNTAGDP